MSIFFVQSKIIRKKESYRRSTLLSSDQSQALGAIDIPQLSKIDLTWPDLSIYIIQPALANKPDIEEITNYPIEAGADKFEILLQTLHHFPFTGRIFRLQHHSMLIQDRHTLFDIWCVHDVIYAVDPNDNEFVASF